MKKVSLGVSIASIVLLALPLGVLADSHEAEAPPPLTDVWIMVPKQGMEAQFVEAAEAHIAFRAEAGDSRAWMAFSSVIGKHPNVYQFRSCCYDWADLDGYDEESAEKGFDENWNQNVHQYVDHYHHYFDETDWENSNWPDSDTDYKYYGVSSRVWKQDAGSAAYEARSKISELAKEHGWENSWLWLSQVGGSPTLRLVSRYENFADMESPEQDFYELMSEKVGKEVIDALFADYNSGFESSDYTIWMRVEALSTPSDE